MGTVVVQEPVEVTVEERPWMRKPRTLVASGDRVAGIQESRADNTYGICGRCH